MSDNVTPPATPTAGELLGRDFITSVVVFHEAVGALLGISATDRKSLDLISRGPVTAGDLARFTGLSTGAITGMIDRLVKAGYVERRADPADRRRVLVHRREDTRLDEVLPAVFGPLGADMAELNTQYTPEQLAAIADYMARTREILVRHTRRISDVETA
ncbi:MarR family transcriptional regulator [Nocardia nova]|uniref:MarR family transcriptional regulator n=1 Tax=Nocardia nova TaxID=37330 RepID=UPI0033C532C6